MEEVKHSLQETIKHLEERHKELEYNIAWGYSNYLNDIDMGKMKKEKLMIKDRIEQLRNEL
jgi:hypothetical protein